MEQKNKTIIAYKGFDKGLKCRGFQYEVGKEYELPKGELPKACENGFHACENPADLFIFYSPNEGNRYCLVELSGVIDSSSAKKTCASRIKIIRELTIKEVVDARIKYTKEHIIDSATGDFGASSETGYRGASSATGYRGASSATGDYGASSATGDFGASSAGGLDSIALAAGYKCKAKGSLGCWLVIAEREEYDYKKRIYPIKDVKAVKVDGAKIKPDTWYMLVDGELVEVEGIDE